jgi:mono/diheme cytochrome c family protein
MDKKQQQDYMESYTNAKKKGVPFFPNIVFKDAVISLIVFLILIVLAKFLGAPLEARANPADTSYTPRPEWYFLFLFQLLKYFPGKLEVVGVIIVPTIAILLLFFLPILDSNPKRHFSKRPVVISVTGLALVGIIFLTIQSVREAPPPAEAASGDQVAALYANNCAPCHGTSIPVVPGTNLHDIIAQGKHAGMPAWSADLSSDQIDALAGFILSPGGSQLFTDNCSECHDVTTLVGGNPIDIKQAVEAGLTYPPHSGLETASWSEILSSSEKVTLLNFLVAPDGQRLFSIYCSSCHGQSVAYNGDETQLRDTITQGGQHLEMPPWRDTLSETDINLLSNYVVDPGSVPEGPALFSQYCSSCHGEQVPNVSNFDQAHTIIADGGQHQTMPVWGSELTEEQIDALVSYTINAAAGTSLEVGQSLFSQNCAPCHGEFGEGGPNPNRPSDTIPPISTAEYLITRDDFTFYSIISYGQPNMGMSPFGTANGGPLEDDQINAIVAYIRAWQDNPPVDLPAEIKPEVLSLSAAEIYADICTQCHGPNGEGSSGAALNTPQIQNNPDQVLFDAINVGFNGSSMIGWGSILSSDQIQGLVDFIRQFPSSTAQPTPTTVPTFTSDILPIFQAYCHSCHGTLGGWDASTYQSIMTSGNNGNVIIRGDIQNSILAQRIQGIQTVGTNMPPGNPLPDNLIQLILDWIAAGAPEN